MNCGAIPAQLVEGALFGHEKGSFTGAVQQQKGIFEAADGGTVLLDEMGELPAAAQAALLRVLETKRVVRVGSTREIEVDVRLIAATHRDLEAMCATGAFRADLYYRLSAMVLNVPPLRDRREDIAPLAARFLARAAAAAGLPPRTLDAGGPGAARELPLARQRARAAQRHRARGRGCRRRSDRAMRPARAHPLPQPPRHRECLPTPQDAASRSGGSLKERMDRFERDTLLEALRECSGNQSEAARRLDVPLRTLQHKVKTHGIPARCTVPAASPRADRTAAGQARANRANAGLDSADQPPLDPERPSSPSTSSVAARPVLHQVVRPTGDQRQAAVLPVGALALGDPEGDARRARAWSSSRREYR